MPTRPLPHPVARTRRHLARLEPLRAHPSPRMQNAVADRLREIGRRQPALVAATCDRWLVESPAAATQRIVRRVRRARIGGRAR